MPRPPPTLTTPGEIANADGAFGFAMLERTRRLRAAPEQVSEPLVQAIEKFEGGFGLAVSVNATSDDHALLPFVVDCVCTAAK